MLGLRGNNEDGQQLPSKMKKNSLTVAYDRNMGKMRK